jgi:hypothetical protein
MSAATAARQRLVLVAAMVVLLSMDLDVFFFISRVLCTSGDFIIDMIFSQNK